MNFSALTPSFVQLLYFSLMEEFILPVKEVLHRLSGVTVTSKLCAT